MADITLIISDFRAQFPAFSAVSDAQITLYFNMATDFISVKNYGLLKDNSRTLALYLLTAHLLQIAGQVVSNDAVGTVTSATVGGISVSLLQPTASNEFKFWLNQSPYGQQLLGLLSVKAAFGLYVGGSFSQANIRKANGEF
jgi:hypothetical protein